MNQFTLDWLLTVSAYLVLTILSLYATTLYRKAYYKMKKTAMIRSVYYLMIALTADSAYFTIATIMSGYDYAYHDMLTTPPLLIIPKVVLALGLFYFIMKSLSPNEYDPLKESAKKINQASKKITNGSHNNRRR